MTSLPVRRTPHSAPLPFEFNGVVRMTRIGTTYTISTVILAVAALNTGNNALYIAVAFMLGCLLLSGIASKGGLKHLHVEVGGLEEAWAFAPADGVLRIRNRSRIWNVRDVVITSPSLAAPVYLPVLARRSDVTVAASFLFRRRGIANLETLDSYTRYPFGFFLKKRRLRVGSEIVVYPRILPEQVARERFQAVEGEQTSVNRPGSGTEIHSFREFVRGDSLRHVYWKKSASLGRWIMKQTELDAARAVHVAVDPHKPRGVSDDEFEEMISAAASFIHHVVTRGLEVTLSLPRMTLHAREARSASSLFRALALLEPSYEPVYQTLDRHTVLFSAAGDRHDAKSA
jgi:uncharacterized protein (DUF58 family)